MGWSFHRSGSDPIGLQCSSRLFPAIANLKVLAGEDRDDGDAPQQLDQREGLVGGGWRVDDDVSWHPCLYPAGCRRSRRVWALHGKMKDS